MRILGISWAGVKTSQYDQMKSVFSRILSMEPDHERDDFAVFMLPSGERIEVFGPSGPDPAEQFQNNRVEAGILVDDIDEAIGHLLSMGMELVGEKQVAENGGSWQHFRMPDGTVWEVNHDPERIS